MIWRHHGGQALGDSWGITHFLLRESERTGQPARLAWELPEHDYGAQVCRDLIARIAGLLDSTGTIELIKGAAETTIIQHTDIWNGAPYFRMRDAVQRWRPGGTHICYQFDGRSIPTLKNPPANEIPILLSWAPEREFVKVGLPLSLEESIYRMSTCALYVGVCSGMSHVAHSVQCPMLLIQYKQHLDNWHPREGWTKAVGTSDAIAQAKRMLAK